MLQTSISGCLHLINNDLKGTRDLNCVKVVWFDKPW
jgi:hypothetical protein